MDVRLQDDSGDRIVVEYHGVKDADGAGPIDCVVAYEGMADTYIVLWKRPEEDVFQLMWRGNWDSAMKYYVGFVGDLEVEVAGNHAADWSNTTIEKFAEAVTTSSKITK